MAASAKIVLHLRNITSVSDLLWRKPASIRVGSNLDRIGLGYLSSMTVHAEMTTSCCLECACSW